MVFPCCTARTARTAPPGAARTLRCAVRGPRSAGVRGRHGQGVHEAGPALLRAAGRPVRGDPPREWDTAPDAARERIVGFAADHGWPLFVKPARAGSSMGISKVDGLGGLDEAIEEARRHDPRSSSRRCCAAARSSAGCWSSRTGRAPASPRRSPVSAHDFYDFEAKYIDSATGIVPAPLTEEQTERVRELAVRAFDAVSCEGLVRADFFLLDDGEFVINEINTMPGFTPISMYPRMWQETGVSYPELVDRLIEAALRRSTGLR
ncbi:hypothetical protein NKH77_37135 [Streptomyces sp. M19]